jgi:hypothetical protein
MNSTPVSAMNYVLNLHMEIYNQNRGVDLEDSVLVIKKINLAADKTVKEPM